MICVVLSIFKALIASVKSPVKPLSKNMQKRHNRAIRKGRFSGPNETQAFYYKRPHQSERSFKLEIRYKPRRFWNNWRAIRETYNKETDK